MNGKRQHGAAAIALEILALFGEKPQAAIPQLGQLAANEGRPHKARGFGGQRFRFLDAGTALRLELVAFVQGQRFQNLSGTKNRPAGQMLQLLQKFLRRLVALVGLLGHHLVKDDDQARGHLGVEGAYVLGLRLDVLEQALGHVALGEGRLAGQHVIERAAQGVDVAADVGRAAVARLLRGNVIHRADGRARTRHLEFIIVGEFDERLAVFLGEQEVGRLDVAVNDPLLVGQGQSAGSLDDQAACFLRIQAFLFVNVLVKVFALDKLHGENVRAAEGVEPVERDDVLVTELGSVPGFLVEACQHLRPLGQLGRQDFQGDLAAELAVARAVDGSHAAGADTFDDDVRPDSQGRVVST